MGPFASESFSGRKKTSEPEPEPEPMSEPPPVSVSAPVSVSTPQSASECRAVAAAGAGTDAVGPMLVLGSDADSSESEDRDGSTRPALRCMLAAAGSGSPVAVVPVLVLGARVRAGDSKKRASSVIIIDISRARTTTRNVWPAARRQEPEPEPESQSQGPRARGVRFPSPPSARPPICGGFCCVFLPSGLSRRRWAIGPGAAGKRLNSLRWELVARAEPESTGAEAG